MDLKPPIMDVKPPISVPTESRPTLVTVLMTHCHQKYYSRSSCTCGWGTTLTTAEQGYREWVDHIAEAYAASSSLLPVGRQLDVAAFWDVWRNNPENFGHIHSGFTRTVLCFAEAFAAQSEKLASLPVGESTRERYFCPNCECVECKHGD